MQVNWHTGRMVGDEVWVVTISQAHGEGNDVSGVYDSREAAFEALRAEGMTVYIDQYGQVQGDPPNERDLGAWWGEAVPLWVGGGGGIEPASP
jgi:hypothetical protein